MGLQVISLECPGCGRTVATDQKHCSCGRPIIISSVADMASMNTLEINKYALNYNKALAGAPDNKELNGGVGMCFLKLKQYDRAIAAFDKAVEGNFDNAENYFCLAVSLLRGKKAFLAQRCDIDKALSSLETAVMIDPKPVYYLLMAYIKLDYFERKFLKTDPSWGQLLDTAVQNGCSPSDEEQLFGMLDVECPGKMLL